MMMRKRIRAVMIAAAFAFSGSMAAAVTLGTQVTRAETQTGYVNEDYVRIRTSANTSSTANVITKVDYGFTVEILGKTSAAYGYEWYNVGFTYNGEYRTGYIAAYLVTLNDSGSSGGGGSESTEDFETYMTNQGFPESYKDSLRALHAQYPNWVFMADHIDKDWDTVVANEAEHGRSLIYSSAISSWKSTDSMDYNWAGDYWYGLDGSGWVQASTDLVKYALDPRNFINSTNIFMFETLSYNSSVQNASGVSAVISGTFMANSSHVLTYNGNTYNYPSALMYAGQISGVSPYHLATRIRQEVGVSGSDSIFGTLAGYEGFYNYYNQGAYTTADKTAIQNGLTYAQSTDEFSLRPWNTRMKSIIGGAKNIGKNYINRGQDTLYYEKFDMISPYWHQYMTNILAPRSESVSASNAYSQDIKNNTALVFTIPVYDNMPSSVCTAPTTDGSPNYMLDNLGVDGYSITPTFDMNTTDYSLIVESGVTGVNISASTVSDEASISGDGWHDLSVGNNAFNINVTAGNGNVRTYTINVVRKQPPVVVEDDKVSVETSYRIDGEYISKIGVGSSVSDVASNIKVNNGNVKILDSNGNEKSGIIATGDVVKVYGNNGKEAFAYTVIIYGDDNGDGVINILDMAKIKNDILGKSTLSGAYKMAADVSRDGNLDIVDMAKIKNDILGKSYIQQ